MTSFLVLHLCIFAFFVGFVVVQLIVIRFVY